MTRMTGVCRECRGKMTDDSRYDDDLCWFCHDHQSDNDRQTAEGGET